MMTRADLIALLDGLTIDYRLIEHPAVFHVGEGEAIEAALPGAHTKNLFLKDSRGQAWLVCAEQSSRIDLKRLAAVIGAGRLSFGSPRLMADRLGVTPGAVTLFALVNDAGRHVRLVLDAALVRAAFVNFHPLVNTATLGIGAAGLRRFLGHAGARPRVVDFSGPAGPARADCAWAGDEPSYGASPLERAPPVEHA